MQSYDCKTFATAPPLVFHLMQQDKKRCLKKIMYICTIKPLRQCCFIAVHMYVRTWSKVVLNRIWFLMYHRNATTWKAWWSHTICRLLFIPMCYLPPEIQRHKKRCSHSFRTLRLPFSRHLNSLNIYFYDISRRYKFFFFFRGATA